MSDAPYRDQIHFGGEDDDADEVREQALALGYSYYTWGTCEQIFRSCDEPYSFPDTTWRAQDIREREVTPAMNPLVTRLMEYVASPMRTERIKFLSSLSAGFFAKSGDVNADMDRQARELNDLCASGRFCRSGVDRFVAFMGDLIDKKSRRGQIVTVNLYMTTAAKPDQVIRNVNACLAENEWDVHIEAKDAS
jgi:hypothetical protein